MFEIKVRKTGPLTPYKEVVVSSDNVKIDLGLLDDKECEDLAYELNSAVNNLLPDTECADIQLATVCDTLNTWARELNVKECDDPFKNYNLRELVQTINYAVNRKIVDLQEKVYILSKKDKEEPDE